MPIPSHIEQCTAECVGCPVYTECAEAYEAQSAMSDMDFWQLEVENTMDDLFGDWTEEEIAQAQVGRRIA